MARWFQYVRSFVHDLRGATAIEYGLIAVVVGLGLIVGLFTFGGKLPEAFNIIGNAITNQI
jgi:pilus assembly protein Flp/PilA